MTVKVTNDHNNERTPQREEKTKDGHVATLTSKGVTGNGCEVWFGKLYWPTSKFGYLVSFKETHSGPQNYKALHNSSLKSYVIDRYIYVKMRTLIQL